LQAKLSEKTSQADPLVKAKNYAFLLLKFRPRSEKELARRLKKKKFSEPVIQQVISSFKETNLINDADFTRTWIEYRLKRPFGLRRIAKELRDKGIDKNLIAENLQSLKGSYDESQTVEEIVRRLVKKYSKLEPQKARRRISGYLLRRGFAPESIIETLNSHKYNSQRTDNNYES